jgi:3-hydroxybutyryl-CoA dehydrogenase
MRLSKVAVIGAGTMGNGIAQWFTQCGAQVELTDVNSEALKKAQDKTFASWDKLAAKGKFTTDQTEQFKSNYKTCTIDELNPSTDLVIEAIIENIDIKVELFKKLDQHFAGDTFFASNTSSIPIASMASQLSESRKSKFVGIHFFNPAPIMKLVEIIKTPWVAKKNLSFLENWFEEQGKKPALCNDRPGFIVNRVARNFYGEALRIAKSPHEEHFREIDETLKEVGGFRMGPFELMDLIGIDVNFDVTQSVWKSFFYEPRFAPHALQQSMVNSGRFGKKTAQGFYSYE